MECRFVFLLLTYTLPAILFGATRTYLIDGRQGRGWSDHAQIHQITTEVPMHVHKIYTN